MFYIEYLYLIKDYFKTLRFSYWVYEIILPFILGVYVYISVLHSKNIMFGTDFRDNTLTLLGVLTGFTITIITILTTSHSRNIEEIKNTITKVKLKGKNISLFQLLTINYTYLIIIEIFLVIANLLYPILSSTIKLCLHDKVLLLSINVFVLVHILLLTIRNMTNFYFIISKKPDIPKKQLPLK